MRGSVIRRLSIGALLFSGLLLVVLVLLYRPPESTRPGPAGITERSFWHIAWVVSDWHYEHGDDSASVTSIEEFEQRYASGVRELNREKSFQVPLDESGRLLDGWGRRLAFLPEVGVYSVGPNGLDEGGQGDDMVGVSGRHANGRVRK
jgi:hypothetical protein